MVLLVLLGTQVISAFGARATPEYSLISAFGTPGTRRGTRECSVISAVGTPGTRDYSVISALGTLGTESCKMTATRESLTTTDPH